MNTNMFSSESFKDIYTEEKYDLMIAFLFNGKIWTISLYSTKIEIDCSVLAKSMGGGGHKGAAGFTTTNIKEVFGNII